MKDQITQAFRALQDDICLQLSAADGGTPFREDSWERPGGGGGRARVIQGQRIEKGGVNFSAVHGELPPPAAKSLGVDPESSQFYATGVSIVLHPKHPRHPIIHMNVRYFELEGGRQWFGGGIDLTPHYVRPEQARWFHEQLKSTCDRFDPGFYTAFKKEADDYFYIPHRQETRGVGGIFYDRLTPDSTGKSLEELFDFTLAVGNTFCPIYVPIIEEVLPQDPTEAELNWQHIRRGRYVEFNLVWDRGTKFGLTTNGRTESILMSLPPLAGWAYDHQPKAGSDEAETLGWLRKGVEWV